MCRDSIHTYPYQITSVLQFSHHVLTIYFTSIKGTIYYENHLSTMLDGYVEAFVELKIRNTDFIILNRDSLSTGL